MKRVSAVVLIILSVFIIYSLNSWLPKIFLNAGKKAYEQKDYKLVSEKLKTAHRFDKNNRDIRYYYVQALIKLPPTLDVQKRLYNLSEENLSDTADLIADRQINLWRNQISEGIGTNYIEQAPFNNMILRWDARKFPLTVYIKNSSPNTIPDYYLPEIKKAFLQWQASTQNFIKFKFVDNRNAQIIVEVVSSNTNANCKNEGCKYVVAYTSPILSGDLLQRMNITFYDSTNLSKPFTQREIYNTALHEIGHALGIMGHSYNKDDLMYMEKGQDEMFDKVRSDFQMISQIDLNTLSLLYKLIPDISNTVSEEFDTRRQFFAPIVLGNSKQIASRKEVEARRYIESAPNLPNGYIDLAAACLEQKKFSEAIDALSQALEFASNEEEKFVIYYNFAVVYLDVKDWDNAIKYANMAKQIKPDADIDGLIATVQFSSGENDAAKQTFRKALDQNPRNIVNAINLARVYIKEFDLINAGKTLNEFIKKNPDLKNDSRLKKYTLLTFFFK